LNASTPPNKERHLVYVYCEPLNRDEMEEVRIHAAEVAELRDRICGREPPASRPDLR
jgi:hypothetical protein